MKAYDPTSYWNSRQHPNTQVDPGIRADDSDFIQRTISGKTSIMEFGPGVGRLFPLYQGKKVATLDLSTNYSARLNAQASACSVQLDEYFRSSPKEAFPFWNNQFQVGIVSQVLLHVPFDLINFTLLELTRVCECVAIINTHDDKWNKDPGDSKVLHCFAHDFLKLAGDLNLILSVHSQIKNRPYCFTLQRR